MTRKQPYTVSSILVVLLTALFLLGIVLPADALNIRSDYSRRNSERPARKSTRFILLHTTEGPAAGSLAKLKRNGEAHYLVERSGRVTRIIHRKRVALHAGRSMWDGRRALDNSSIGIEIVGYHNKSLTKAQYTAVRDLLVQLKKIYNVPDSRILPHSMVAYGAPNRWHRRSHRGRKRCGMGFATTSVRRKLGLGPAPRGDPDVAAKRLVVADKYLAKVLYGNRKERTQGVKHFTAHDATVIGPGRSAWDIARGKYKSADTVYVFPDGTRKNGNRITNWKKIPRGTKVLVSSTRSDEEEDPIQTIGVDGSTALEVAGDEYNARSTIYFYPDGRVRSGSELSKSAFRNLPKKTKLLVGYVNGGRITASRSAFQICGAQWNTATTYYRLPGGALVPGNRIDERNLPRGAMVFYPS